MSELDNTDAIKAARARVYRSQARREHSRLELQHKLTRAGYASAVVSTVLDELTADGVVDDRRFAESFVRARVERGYGPQRVRQELRALGIIDEIVADALAPYAREWQQRLEKLATRRGAFDDDVDASTQARHARFLTRRGFGAQAVNKLVLKGLTRKGRADDEEVE